MPTPPPPAGARPAAPFACRPNCGACCVAPSISSAIPGMPGGKPAGARCAQLGPDERCQLFGRPSRPAVCGGLKPSPEMCGNSRAEALGWLAWMEAETRPAGSPPPAPG